MTDEFPKEIKEEIISESAPEKASSKRASRKSKGVEVALLAGGRIRSHHICVNIMDKRAAYLVPIEKCILDRKATFSIDPSDEDVILLYDWTREIEAMLPEHDEMVNNVRLSLWKAGAHTKRDLAGAKKWKHSAFPYQITLSEEE